MLVLPNEDASWRVVEGPVEQTGSLGFSVVCDRRGGRRACRRFVFRFNRAPHPAGGSRSTASLDSPSATSRCATGTSYSTHDQAEPARRTSRLGPPAVAGAATREPPMASGLTSTGPAKWIAPNGSTNALRREKRSIAGGPEAACYRR